MESYTQVTIYVYIGLNTNYSKHEYKIFITYTTKKYSIYIIIVKYVIKKKIV